MSDSVRYAFLFFFSLVSSASEQVPEGLRGGIEVDAKTLEQAFALKAAGCEYVMLSEVA
ncbi:MAG: hypothetical protein MK080_11505 [Opitutales bacterium]|nr:hypothetical protein [Opitutales bacterium]NRA27485.1 hypothetical protein [Opitutales bacterium]